MFGTKWLTNKYNEIQFRRKLRAHHDVQLDQMLKAINREDPGKFLELVEDTMEIDKFLTRDRFDTLLRETIKADHLILFDAVKGLHSEPDVNYKFYESSSLGVDAGYWYAYTPLISAAISEEAEKIALQLANDPDLNLNATPYSHSSSTNSMGEKYREDEYGPTPALQARKKGLNQVAAVLYEREAEALTAQAKELRQQTPR